MKLVKLLDDFFMERAQRLSHGVQSFTGATCYRQAAWCASYWYLVVGLDTWNYFHPIMRHHMTTGPGMLLFACLAFVMTTLLVIYFRHQEEQFLEHPDVLPIARGHSFLRFLFWGLCLVNIALWLLPSKDSWNLFDLLDDLGPFSFLVMYHLLDVVPRPPGRSKIREWLDSFFLAPAPAQS